MSRNLQGHKVDDCPIGYEDCYPSCTFWRGRCVYEEITGGHQTKPIVVCLCGSGRFRQAFADAEYDETLAGKIVLTIGCNAHDIAREEDLKHYKPMLDELHLWKIDLADEILVLNVGGYVGESTSREIAYAKTHNKRIRWLEEDKAPPDPAGDKENS